MDQDLKSRRSVIGYRSCRRIIGYQKPRRFDDCYKVKKRMQVADIAATVVLCLFYDKSADFVVMTAMHLLFKREGNGMCDIEQ